MKRILLTIACLAALCSLHAQDSIVAPSVVGGEEALSEKFSKTFCLPQEYVVTHFDYILVGEVSKDGYFRIYEDKFISPVAKRTSQGFSATSDDLLAAVRLWRGEVQNKIVLRPGIINGMPADSMPCVVNLRYSPLFFAKTGDTLFCDGEPVNRFLVHGEKSAMYYEFYVHNQRNTPYYATVRRNDANLTLHYFDTILDKPFLIEKYIVASPNRIIKNGFQQYLVNGKVHHRQYYELDTLRYAEEFDSNNKVYAKYFMERPLWGAYFQLKSKEIYYPSGRVEQRIEYTKNDPVISVFNEDGTKGTYTPSDAQKVIEKYFKKHFKAPKTSKAGMVNYFTVQISMKAHIGDDGKISCIEKKGNTTNWSYNYRTGEKVGPYGVHTNVNASREAKEKEKIDAAIKEHYNPILLDFINNIGTAELYCKPAKLNGKSVESNETIQITYEFAP